MPKLLCGAAQPGDRERISAPKLGAALGVGLTLAVLSSAAPAWAALVLHGPDPQAAAVAEPTEKPATLLIPDDVPAARGPQLTLSDAEAYREAFALQRDGAWDAADAVIAKIVDKRLMGHLLAQRYLHPERRAAYWELADWMARYADHPDADAIHALAERRQPAGSPSPRRPRIARASRIDGDLERMAGFRADPGGLFTLVSLPSAPETPTGEEDGVVDRGESADSLETSQARQALRVAPRGRSSAVAAPNPTSRVMRRLRTLLDSGDAAAAWDFLNTDEAATSLDRVEFDAIRTRIAESFYQAGQVADALALSSASAARSSSGSTKANWTAGLAAWRAKNYDRAARHFEAVVESRPRSPWFSAAAAYWAGRALLRGDQPDRARVYLAAAARFPHTFYGLVAERTLGATPQLRWTLPTLTPAHLAALARQPAGRRGIALLQIDENDRAERELRSVSIADKPLAREALMVLADRGGMAEFSLRLGNAVEGPDGAAYDAALYPVPHWRPRDGFQIDPALIFAVVRQESRFEVDLVSSAGATGLMQIMPATARHISHRHDDIDGADRDTLVSPELNLELGQRYIRELMEMPAIGDNLIYLTAAFNAGPGNLINWKKRFGDIKDPLLFIESVPFGETRDYFEKVLANYWIYGMRMGRDTSSLDDVAAGRWPRYTPIEPDPRSVSMVVRENAEN